MQDIFNTQNFDNTMAEIANAEASIANLRGENKARTMENNANTEKYLVMNNNNKKRVSPNFYFFI